MEKNVRNKNNDLFFYGYFTEMEKRYFRNCFDHSLYPNLTGRCQKIGNIELQTNSYLLIGLIFWKLAYLISQLRTEFRKKLFWLTTCPKGVLLGFLIFTTSVQGCLCEKWPLKSKSMSPTLTPTEFSTLTYYHQFAHRLEIHLYSDKTVDTWDSNRHEFAKTWHFKHTDPEKILYRMFHIGKNIYCFILRYNGVVSSLNVHSEASKQQFYR